MLAQSHAEIYPLNCRRRFWLFGKSYEHKVQRMDAENFCKLVSWVAKAPPTNGKTVAGRSVLGLHHCWGGAVTARAEVEGDSSSHVAARGLDGRRGYIVEGSRLHHFLEGVMQLL